MTTSVNYRQSQFATSLNNVTEKTNNLSKTIRVDQRRRKIKENIIVLLEKLKQIEEIILLSRLQILPRDIFTDVEINEYKIDATTLQHIRTAVFENSGLILIVIQIPVFPKKLYFLTRIVPIPNKDKKELQIDDPYIIRNENNVFKNMKSNLLKDLEPPQDKCINYIMNQNVTLTCIFKREITPSIEEISHGIIVTKNLEKTVLKTSCNDYEQMIKGHNLLTFDKCNITIGNQSFTNHIMTEKIIRRNQPDNS